MLRQVALRRLDARVLDRIRVDLAADHLLDHVQQFGIAEQTERLGTQVHGCRLGDALEWQRDIEVRHHVQFAWRFREHACEALRERQIAEGRRQNTVGVPALGESIEQGFVLAYDGVEIELRIEHVLHQQVTLIFKCFDVHAHRYCHSQSAYSSRAGAEIALVLLLGR